MVARLAFFRFAPTLLHARVTPSLAARRAPHVRGYASSSENSVSLFWSEWGGNNSLSCEQ
jgi:hypothetical protein